MRLKVSDIEIEADTVEAIKELFALASTKAVSPVGSVYPSRSAKGPNETRYNDSTGMQLRLSKEEKSEVESGQCTREDIAARRLANVSSESPSGETELPEDNGGEVF
jgi:hypothetical protein